MYPSFMANLTDLLSQNGAGDNGDNTNMPLPPMPVFNPSHDIMNRMTALVNNRPTENPNPSFAHRVGSALVGMGAGMKPLGISDGQPIGIQFNPDAQKSAMDDFNNPKLGDYEKQLKELQPLAQDENATNTNERSLYDNAMTNRTGMLRANIANRAELNKEKSDAAKLAVSQQRADAYTFHQTHPQYEGRIDKDGMLVYVNKTDPTQAPVKTNIDTGKMSDIEKIQAGIAGRLQEIGAQNSTSAARFQIVQEYDENGKPVGSPVRVNKLTGETSPIDTSGKPIKGSPATASAAGTTTESTTEAPNTDILHKLSFGLLGPDTNVTKQTTTVKRPFSVSPVIGPGAKIKMQSPPPPNGDGKTYMVDPKDVDESIKHGWKKVG